MEKVQLFSERQRFRQWWLWLVMFAVSGLFVYAFVQQIIFGHAFGNKPMSNAGVIGSFLSVLLLNALLFFVRLDTEVNQEGIHVRFYPFHLRTRHYTWTELAQYQLRKYYPLAEYGGWGLRLGLRNGKAYTVSGNTGLQLVFTNGKKLLIGTNRGEALQQALEAFSKAV